MNRWRIYDSLDDRYLHIGYDSRATARRALDKISTDGKRFFVVDTQTLRKTHPRRRAADSVASGAGGEK